MCLKTISLMIFPLNSVVEFDNSNNNKTRRKINLPHNFRKKKKQKKKKE